MRNKTYKQKKVNIITLGCSKNMVDSEILSGQLTANDIKVEHESVKMDYNIAVINTCGFIDKAKEESINTILEQVALKKRGLIEKVYVTGCLSERYRQDLLKEIPEVDSWFGTLELPLILKTLNADYKAELIGERLLSTPNHYAYLKISEGCNRTCSFCAIPLMRGGHISKPIEQIVQEAENLVKKGVKEIILIAQELTYYGLDIYKKRMLPELLEKLSEIQNLEWIRLHYAYPSKFPLDVLRVIRESEKVCNYLDIPLQHCNDDILKSMKRQISKQEIYNLIDKIRQEVPDISLRTTFIVGYPEETEERFEELKSFIQEIQFDRVGVFTYSQEEDTSAYQLGDPIPQAEKERRAEELMAIQHQISYEKNQKFINRSLKVLIDRKEAGRYIGRTEFDSVEVDNEVIIHTKDNIEIGDFVNVLITKAYDYDLEGELVV